MKYVALYHRDTASDELLSKLGTITTSRKILLCGLKNVSSNEVYNVISKFSDRLTSLDLEENGLVTNKIIISLGELKNLSYLKLKSLKNVTDEGIYGLLDMVNPLILPKLLVKNCTNITKRYIAIAEQKIKVVEHT